MKSRIVIFEGGDISGKTTQANLYYDKMLKIYNRDPKNSYKPVYKRYPKNKNSEKMIDLYNQMNKFVLSGSRKAVGDTAKQNIIINNMIEQFKDKFEFFNLIYELNNGIGGERVVYIIDRCLISGTIYNFHALKRFYEINNEPFPLEKLYKEIIKASESSDSRFKPLDNRDSTILSTIDISKYGINFKESNILHVIFKPSKKLYNKTMRNKTNGRINDEYDSNAVFQECVNHYYDILTSGNKKDIDDLLGIIPPIVPVITDNFDVDSPTSIEDISDFIIDKCEDFFYNNI